MVAAGKPHRFQPGVSGNPNGRPKGSKTKITLTKEAFEEVAGLSPGEMLAMIAQRHFAQNTAAGDALAIKAIMEANKYIEPTKDAIAENESLTDMSKEEITNRLRNLKIVNDE
jgi:flagellin-specific chaperone FliS